MKLFVDDERHPFNVVANPNDWIVVRNVEDAWLIVQSLHKFITEMSLDHDLGEGRLTGYDLLLKMAEENIWPIKSIYIHSMNPVGRERMNGIVQRYFIGVEN